MAETFEFKEAALPNIFGSFTLGQKQNTNCVAGWVGDGAFYAVPHHINASVSIQGSITDNYNINAFDASRCSPIYKMGIHTVQPPAFTVMYIIKIK